MTQLVAALRCPACRQTSLESMPADHCVFFFECPHCHTVLRPKPGHCCVFCSYADVRCPACQIENSCITPTGDSGHAS
jgi:hypothetical protein